MAFAPVRVAESEFGALAPVLAFARTIPGVSWFAAATLPLTEADCADGAAYAAALGFADAAVEAAASWPDAKRIASGAGAAPWWDAEESAAKALYETALRAAPERAVLAALTRATDAASATVHGAASIALARAGIADAALARAAAGAATQACYHAALALAARAGAEHAFAIKARLYAGGRWPLGIVDGALYLL